MMMLVMLVTAAEGFFGIDIWNSPVFIISIIDHYHDDDNIHDIHWFGKFQIECKDCSFLWKTCRYSVEKNLVSNFACGKNENIMCG